jgi:tetratricopeptide (TPR) repeat protein
VARILEADTFESADGPQPFLAMEIVPGQPLHHYIEQTQPDLSQRLQLLAQICEAVQHAHQKGILHRDLKPANIMVTNEGRTSVLDFGVARPLLAGELTEAGQMIGTLAYMSPEQLASDPAQVDTRADVYSLGVLLFELLSGQLPHGGKTVSSAELVRAIQEQDPPTLKSLNRSLPLDLSAIAEKALEKDRERRYASVADFHGDLMRFLREEPVVARPASGLYRFYKFARRRRALVGGALVVVLLTVTGFIAILTQSSRARKAEQIALQKRYEAEREAAALESVTDFLTVILGSEDPGSRPDDFTVLEALQQAETRLVADQNLDPRAEAAVRIALGSSYSRARRFDQALPHLDRALELRKEVYGADHFKVGAACNTLAVSSLKAGDPQRAADLLREARRIDALRPEQRPAYSAISRGNLSWVLSTLGRHRDAEELMRTAIAEQSQRLGEDSLPVAISLNTLAAILRELPQRLPDSRDALRKAQQVFARHPANPHHASCLHSLSVVEYELGNVQRSVQLVRRAIDIHRELRGTVSTDAWQLMDQLILRLDQDGQDALATQVMFDELGLRLKLGGPDNQQVRELADRLLTLVRDDGRAEGGYRIAALFVQAYASPTLSLRAAEWSCRLAGAMVDRAWSDAEKATEQHLEEAESLLYDVLDAPWPEVPPPDLVLTHAQLQLNRITLLREGPLDAHEEMAGLWETAIKTSLRPIHWTGLRELGHQLIEVGEYHRGLEWYDRAEQLLQDRGFPPHLRSIAESLARARAAVDRQR